MAGSMRHFALVIAGLVVPPLAAAGQTRRAAPPGRITDAPDGISQVELVTFDPALAPALRATALEASVRLGDWPVAPGLRRTVVVARHDIYAPDARIVAIDRGKEVDLPRSKLVFFWGTVEGDGASAVMIALDPDTGTLSGFTMSNHGGFDLLPPAAARPGQHLVAAPAALRRPGDEKPRFACGLADLPADGEGRLAPFRPPDAGREHEPRLPSSLHTAVLAVDTDNELMGIKFSDDTQAATNWIAAAIAGLSALYERDLFIRFHQGYTILRLSSTPDPYEQNVSDNADGAKLSEFSNYWRVNYTGVKRALTMMISGKQPTDNVWSGIAWIDHLCSSFRGYSFTQVFRTGTTAGSEDTWALGHEVGHNFGSQHTHCTDTASAPGTQPIDFCYEGETCPTGPWNPNPGTSCPVPFTINPVNGPPVTFVRGTIMSYCNFIGGCPVTNVFHPQTVNALSSRIDAAVGACLFPLSANPAPAVAGINPLSGSTSGATMVTITGTNFRSPASVAFAGLEAGRAATSVTVVSPTTITALTPAHSVGLKDVVVMNPDQQTGTRKDAYTYVPTPTVAAINPNGGTTSGGTAVTITGTNFSAPATVTLGGTAATSVNVASSATITATTPGHAAGIVDVVVSIPGPLTGTLAGGYFYFTPAPPGKFFTLTPCRLVDTRNAAGPLGGPALGPSSRRDFTLTSVCGIPTTAKALSVNVTVTGGTAPGFVSLFPGNGIPPSTSNINFSTDQTRANNAVVLLATDGAGALAALNGAAGTLHFILDVNGYFE